MEKAADYWRRAEECRLLARSHEGEQRELLMSMAAQWEALARQREELHERRQGLSEPSPPPGADPTAG